MKRPSSRTVKRQLDMLRSEIINGDDPIASRVAYAIETSVRWMIEKTDWEEDTMISSASVASRLIRDELEDQRAKA